MSLPTHFKLLYREDEIRSRIKELGKEIDQKAQQVWDESHTDLVAIPILRGAIFFFSDLVREIKSSVEIAPARAWGYQLSESGAQELRSEMTVSLESIPAKGRSVLLVDDICDSGRTLHVLKQHLLKAGAREVQSAALVMRKVKDEIFTPDWIGFHYDGPEWLVGYGMDDNDRFRNLSSIYTIKQN